MSLISKLPAWATQAKKTPSAKPVVPQKVSPAVIGIDLAQLAKDQSRTIAIDGCGILPEVLQPWTNKQRGLLTSCRCKDCAYLRREECGGRKYYCSFDGGVNYYIAPVEHWHICQRFAANHKSAYNMHKEVQNETV